MTTRGFLLSSLTLAAFAVSLLYFHRLETRPPAWDESVHLQLALDYRDQLVAGQAVTSPWAAVYPPLYHLSLIPTLSTGKPSQARATATHVFFLALLLGGLLMLAKDFGHTPEDAMVAALLFLAGPLALFTERRALIDFPLVAWEVMGLALLWRTRHFENGPMTLAWAVWSGFGMLLKPFYGFAFVGPCLWLLWTARDLPNPWLAHRWRNFLFAALLIALISSVWYAWHGADFFRNVSNIANERYDNEPSATTLDGWLYYFKNLPTHMGGAGLGLLGILLGLTVARWRRMESRGLWVSWAISVYLFTSVMQNKQQRYSLPVTAALCLLAGLGAMGYLKRDLWRRLALGAMLFFFLGSAYTLDLPRTENWKHKEMAAVLARHAEPESPFVLVSVLSNHPSLFGRNLRWTARTQGITLHGSRVGNPLADFTQLIVMKTGDLGPSAVDLRREEETLLQNGRAFHGLFVRVERFGLPDGSEATIYARNREPHFRVPTTRQALERQMTKVLSKFVKGPLSVRIEGSPAQWREGRFQEIRISGGPWMVRGLPVAAADIRFFEAWVNLYQLFDHAQPGLLAFKRLEPRVRLTSTDLQNLLKDRVKKLENVQVTFLPRGLEVRATYKGTPMVVAADLFVDLDLIARFTKIQIGKVPISPWMLGKLRTYTVPLNPIPSFPGRLDIGRVTFDGETLQIAPQDVTSYRR